MHNKNRRRMHTKYIARPENGSDKNVKTKVILILKTTL